MMSAPQIRATSVLVIDDCQPVRAMVRRMLFDIGLRDVREAEDLSDADKALKQFTPGLIIIDWYLPEGTCEGLLQTVRDPERSSCPDVPVILMTALPTFSLVDRAQDLEVACLLRKPFSPRMLWDRVATVLPFREPGRAHSD